MKLINLIKLWIAWLWQEQNAIRYERKIKNWTKMIKNNQPFADFYREWADELHDKLKK